MTTPTVPTLTADNRTLGTYISDMMALERHLDEAFERQESFTKDYPEAHEMILQLISTTRNHIMVLDRRIKELNEKTFTDSLKSAIAGLFGVAAGVVDAIRPLHISKALRDDYTAMNHAIVGYVMLQTTASALNDQTTLKIADDFLRDYLRLTQLVIGIIPSITLKDLESSGVPIVNRSAPKQVTSNKQFSMLFNPSQGLSTTVSGGR